MKVKPFVKWAGGKGSLIPQLRNYYPLELENGIIETYIEPFVGGGAVLIDMLQNYKIKKAYAFDINAELINCYNVIKMNVNELVTSLSELEKEYTSLDTEERKEFYYNKRNEYNSYRLQENETSVKKASEFIFLNRTCFNGLYRVNKNGDFNVPMGNYKNPTVCDKQNLKALSKLLKNVEFKSGNYAESTNYAKENTFVYFDPPYRPLNITSSFTSYTKEDFDDEEQKQLGNFYRELNRKNSKLMLSNSNPKNMNKSDTFFEDIYKGFNINEVYAKRMINSDSTNRGAISELVITNYEKEINQYTIFDYVERNNVLKQAIPV